MTQNNAVAAARPARRNFKTIDSSRFRLWLEMKAEFQKNAEVGFRRSGASCPIANYLSETRQARGVNVTNTISYRARNGRNRSYAAPKWVTAFIAKVDAGANGAIRAKEALAALDEVKPVK